ncbi:MAG: DUF5610 domain-containing protein [Oligoflexia bacterium]|nr:DUF5610 domain-containing protein [Oligoflexia bacterium]
MDSLLSLEASGFSGSVSSSSISIKYSERSLVISKTLGDSDATAVDVGVGSLEKSLVIKGQKIIEKLNQLLKAKLPDGIASLKPEEVTPDATADRIVKGATAFFDAYAKNHPELAGEDLISGFMALIRKGIDAGYEDAYNTLSGLGAFEFDGVEEGIKQTKGLIESKLVEFENLKRKELGVDPDTTQSAKVQSSVSSDLLAQGGFNIAA